MPEKLKAAAGSLNKSSLLITYDKEVQYGNLDITNRNCSGDVSTKRF